MSTTDASREQISEGDLVEIASPRGAIRAKVRISDIREKVLFVPFHYGYWDRPADEAQDRSRARTSWPSPTGIRYPSSRCSKPPRPQ
jgi:anaerobic selenocysteine-containing dehydrogenase